MWVHFSSSVSPPFLYHVVFFTSHGKLGQANIPWLYYKSRDFFFILWINLQIRMVLYSTAFLKLLKCSKKMLTNFCFYWKFTPQHSSDIYPTKRTNCFFFCRMCAFFWCAVDGQIFTYVCLQLLCHYLIFLLSGIDTQKYMHQCICFVKGKGIFCLWVTMIAIVSHHNPSYRLHPSPPYFS